MLLGVEAAVSSGLGDMEGLGLGEGHFERWWEAGSRRAVGVSRGGVGMEGVAWLGRQFSPRKPWLPGPAPANRDLGLRAARAPLEGSHPCTCHGWHFSALAELST